jgi:hypothetical protein
MLSINKLAKLALMACLTFSITGVGGATSKKLKAESANEGATPKKSKVEGTTPNEGKNEGGTSKKGKVEGGKVNTDQTTGEDKTKAKEPVKEQVKTLKEELKQEGKVAQELLKTGKVEVDKAAKTDTGTNAKPGDEKPLHHRIGHHLARFFIKRRKE